VGHRARLAVSAAQAARLDDQAHAARALWNLLHEWWTMIPREKRSLETADAAIRQARHDIELAGGAAGAGCPSGAENVFSGVAQLLGGPRRRAEVQGAVAVGDGRRCPAGAGSESRSCAPPLGPCEHPKLGRVRFRWTRDLPVGKRAEKGHRVTGARLVKDALGWHIVLRIECCSQPLITTAVQRWASTQECVWRWRCRTATPRPRAWLTDKEQAKLVALQQKAAHQGEFPQPGRADVESVAGNL